MGNGGAAKGALTGRVEATFIFQLCSRVDSLEGEEVEALLDNGQ